MLTSNCNLCGEKIAEAESVEELEIKLENIDIDYFEPIYERRLQENPYYFEDENYTPIVHFDDTICNECYTTIIEFIKVNVSTKTNLEIIGPKIASTATIAIADFTDDTNDIENKEIIINESSTEIIESEEKSG